MRPNSCLNSVHCSACSLVQVPPSNIIWFNSLSFAVVSSTLVLPWSTASDRVVTNSGRSTPACARASPNEPARAIIMFSCATSSRSFRSLLSVSSKALNFGIKSAVSTNPLDHATPRLSISLFVELTFSVKSSKAAWATLNSSIPFVMVSKNALYPVAISGNVMVLNLAFISSTTDSNSPSGMVRSMSIKFNATSEIGIPSMSVNSLSLTESDSSSGMIGSMSIKSNPTSGMDVPLIRVNNLSLTKSESSSGIVGSTSVKFSTALGIGTPLISVNSSSRISFGVASRIDGFSTYNINSSSFANLFMSDTSGSTTSTAMSWIVIEFAPSP